MLRLSFMSLNVPLPNAMVGSTQRRCGSDRLFVNAGNQSRVAWRREEKAILAAPVIAR
jgi:hypothetical protein